MNPDDTPPHTCPAPRCRGCLTELVRKQDRTMASICAELGFKNNKVGNVILFALRQQGYRIESRPPGRIGPGKHKGNHTPKRAANRRATFEQRYQRLWEVHQAHPSLTINQARKILEWSHVTVMRVLEDAAAANLAVPNFPTPINGRKEDTQSTHTVFERRITQYPKPKPGLIKQRIPVALSLPRELKGANFIRAHAPKRKGTDPTSRSIQAYLDSIDRKKELNQ